MYLTESGSSLFAMVNEGLHLLLSRALTACLAWRHPVAVGWERQFISPVFHL